MFIRFKRWRPRMCNSNLVRACRILMCKPQTWMFRLCVNMTILCSKSNWWSLEKRIWLTIQKFKLRCAQLKLSQTIPEMKLLQRGKKHRYNYASQVVRPLLSESTVQRSSLQGFPGRHTALYCKWALKENRDRPGTNSKRFQKISRGIVACGQLLLQ